MGFLFPSAPKGPKAPTEAQLKLQKDNQSQKADMALNQALAYRAQRAGLDSLKSPTQPIAGLFVP